MSPDARRPAYRLVVTALVFWAFAATAYATLRLRYGDRPVYVHVRWSPAVDDAARQHLEQRYRLALAEPKEGRTFGYALTDRSRDNVMALVRDPAVEDTHQIHRTKFRTGYLAPRLPYLTSHPSLPVGLEILAILCFLGGVASLGLAWLGAAAPALVQGRVLAVRDAFLDPPAALRRSAAQLVSWVAGRIPGASAESVALFRIVFGSALLIFVLSRPVPSAWALDPQNVVSPAQRLLLQIFVEAPWVADWLQTWVAFWGALFIVGAFARPAFASLTVGVLAWALLYTTRTTYHTVSALLLALLALQWSKWSDAWSLDAWRRRAEPSPRGTPQQYGYTVWAPGLVLGLVFAAAALAKLRDSGLAWILNGTVKYHFLSDSTQAMTDLGLQIGRYHWLAVVLSFGAIAIETLVIVGVVARAYRYRLIAGGAALCLLLGFTVLQGLFWPAWWILLLSFLPWHLVRAPAASPAPATIYPASPVTPVSRRLPTLAVCMVMALVAQQLVVSLLKLEVSPVLSTYDMYSTTYGSPAEYEDKAGQAYWLVGLDDAAQAHRCRISRMEVDAIARGGVSADQLLTEPVLRRCFDPSMRLRHVFVEASRVQVDWTQWRRLEEPARVRLSDPIALDPAP